MTVKSFLPPRLKQSGGVLLLLMRGSLLVVLVMKLPLGYSLIGGGAGI